MPSSFTRLITPTQVRALADDRSYQRGEVYFRQGQVKSLAEQGEVVAAQVEGTETYEVEFWIEDDQLGYQCDCPVGLDAWFCKHCVAVGLAWLAHPPASTSTAVKSSQSSNGRSAAVTTLKDVQHYLEQQDQANLVKLILDRAMQDTDWREQLLMKVAAHQPSVDLKTFQRALKNAIVVRGEIDYYQVRSYAHSIEKVLDSITALLETGQPDAVIALCEYAIPLIEDAMQSVDDSDGHLGGILEETQDLHYQACEQAQPEPIGLAGRLFELGLESDFDTFSNAVDTYAEVLGQTGLGHYQELAETEWAKLPAPDPSHRTGYGSHRRRLSHMLEQLARQTGDLDSIVAVKRRDLSTSSTYLQIAQLYQEADQPDQALQWAEDGLKAFPDRPDRRLRDWIISAYQQCGRFEDAVNIVWAMFTESPGLANYQALKIAAERAKQWKEWRKQAIDQIRQQIKQAQTQRQGALSYAFRDHSLFVEIFLWEGETELAWQEAKTGKCSKQLWLKLADQRQLDHPEDALSIYMNEIEPLIQQTNNGAYAQAIEFIKKARSLMLRLNLQDQYEQYTTHLRANYKNKRNFIKLLNQEKL